MNFNVKTELIAKEGSIIHQISEKMTSIQNGYRPPFCCYPTWFNTIARALIQRSAKVKYNREILKTLDGGLVAIDWANINAPQKLILLIIPGTLETSKENYVTHFVDEAVKAGCSAVVLNYRGLEVELTNSRTFSPSFYLDLDMVSNYIHNQYPEHKILALGNSLGGIILGGYLAQEKDKCIISYAMIVCSPMNLLNTMNNLEKGINSNQNAFSEETCAAVSKFKCMREFNELNCKMFGYDSLKDFYEDGCLESKIESIRVPTLFLNSVDDMLLNETDIPIENIKSNPFTALIKTSIGGHAGYSETIFPKGCNYVCRILRDYVQVIL